ncbi:unnamed protein product [Toxocara canis]|uniref:Sulfurtransferase n=1 Tax=Toxocara canis TaxID=6265 RepID=A0A183ULS8_TOXCA|nr:unnamed protein product [Toxocara canis]
MWARIRQASDAIFSANFRLQNGEVKIVDATFAVDPKPDWKKFKHDYYGKFDKLLRDFVRDDYVKKHIHGAVHFNMDIAMYVGEFQRYALYPPKIFEKYVRLLGINNGDHVIVYGRGPLAGMLFSSKVWWLLKYYGLGNVQVLNGGLAAWIAAGNTVDDERVVVKEGNFTAKVNPQMLITFEELERKGADGKALIDKLDTINFFDARPRAMFTGENPQKFASSGEFTGFHLAGAKNLPSPEMVDENGIKPVAELEKVLSKAGYVKGKQTITSCALGVQGALANLALSTLGINDVQLYHGSLTEMALRDPSRISGK